MESQVNRKQFIGRRYVKTVTYMSCSMEVYMSDELCKIIISVYKFSLQTQNIRTLPHLNHGFIQTCVEALDIVGEGAS